MINTQRSKIHYALQNQFHYYFRALTKEVHDDIFGAPIILSIGKLCLFKIDFEYQIFHYFVDMNYLFISSLS